MAQSKISVNVMTAVVFSLLFVSAFWALFSPSLFAAQVSAATKIDLTPEERAWVAEHPVVRLAPDPDFPPLEYFDKDGSYKGIAADFIKLLEPRLPLKFEIVRLDNWTEVIKQAKARQVDMYGAAVPTPERLKYMAFTPPYVEFPAVVLVRDSAQNFPKLSELRGIRVAVVANYADHEYMTRAYPDIPLEVMPDISSGLRQLSFGKVDAMVLNLASASYYIKKDGISNLKVTQDTDFVFDLSFAVRNDWPELVSILEKAMATLTAQERQKIMNNWISLGQDRWRPSPLFISTVLTVCLALLLSAVLLWNRSLKKQVRERTAELEMELHERIQAEQDKEKLQQQVHRVKKMEAVGLLAGGVAHDLNNILSGTVGYADLVLRKLPADNRLKNYLLEIRESGRRAAAVVADLLTLSRDAAARRKVANLNTIVEEYLRSPEHQNLVERFPEVHFRVICDPDLQNIFCSEVHIKKTIMNLLNNAAEATVRGEVTVATMNRINTDEQAPAQTCALITIADEGPGIAEEDLEYIFEPFYSKKRLGHSGTGLGLAVVWNTVQEHQGRIEVKCPGAGCCFELSFPTTDELIESVGPLAREEDLRGHGEHILVVDDEEAVRSLAEALLTNLGYRVSLAASGEEALEFLQHQRVDLLVLDMLMDPGINGYETFKRIREQIPGQKAIIASGFSVSRDVDRVQALGAGAYVKKPYTIEELGLAIKAELSK